MTLHAEREASERTEAGRSRRVGLDRLSGATATRVVLPAVTALVDLTLTLGSILAASRLRQNLPLLANASDVDDRVAALAPFILAGWLIALRAAGTYSAHQLSAGVEEYKNVLNSSVVTAGAVGIVCYLGKIPLSRGFFVLTFMIGIPLLLLGRLLVRRGLHAARRRGLFQHRVLITGDPGPVDELAKVLSRESWLGYRVVGALRGQSTPEDLAETRLGVPYVGQATQVAAASESHHADVIIIGAGSFANSGEMRRTQWDLEDRHIQLIVAPNVTDVARERVMVRPVAGLPLVHLERPQSQGATRGAKRAFDLLGSGALVLVTLPLMVIGAIAVKRFDGGPILFRQTRVGRDGRTFAMLKFRSMVTNAEELIEQMQAQNQTDGVLFKMSEDPRVTRPGRWMRRYSVDELPQLFNVLRGEMSLVGPRPALPREVSRYDADVTRRLRVRPGITGLWQVSGRSDLSWEDTVRLDLYYVDNWSLVRDLSILVRTVKPVLGSRGAY